jgi:hypothetical protein
MYPMFKESKLIETFQTNCGNTPDDRDKKIAENRLKAFDNDPLPRVGDYVIMKDGSYQRFSYAWYDYIQTCNSGSFYLGNGYASMSGSLNPGIAYENLKITLDQKEGYFWIFHHDYHMAHNGIGVKVLCRVYQEV